MFKVFKNIKEKNKKIACLKKELESKKKIIGNLEKLIATKDNTIKKLSSFNESLKNEPKCEEENIWGVYTTSPRHPSGRPVMIYDSVEEDNYDNALKLYHIFSKGKLAGKKSIEMFFSDNVKVILTLDDSDFYLLNKKQARKIFSV